MLKIKKHIKMEERVSMTKDELNAAIAAAVNAAIDAREAGRNRTLISRKACAKRLRVDTSTLWRWHKEGYFPCVKIAGRCYYAEDAIMKLERGERYA